MTDKDILFHILSDRPVAYHPDIGKALKSAQSGLFLSQLLYWTGKSRDPDWVYKTHKEMHQETGLTRREQDTCRKNLKKHSIIDEKLQGVPPKLHYKININMLIDLLENYYSSNGNSKDAPNAQKRQIKMPRSAKSNRTEPPKRKSYKGQIDLAQGAKSPITKSTTKSTSDKKLNKNKLEKRHIKTDLKNRKQKLCDLISVELSEFPPSSQNLLFDFLDGKTEVNFKINKLLEIFKSRVGGASSNFMDLVERKSGQDKD